MKIYIYDIEVFSDDWIVVFRSPESDHHTVIHNDNYHLREFLSQPDIIIGGFNNKYYDDYVLLTMLYGGSNIEVKKHNDFIIKEKHQPWTFEFIKGRRKPFKSFDLKDDLDEGISLKAIEGNLKLPIVESSIPFDIDRKLTPEELEEVIKYCKYDVDSTVKLFEVRKKDYIDAKALVGEMYGLSYADSISPTNAKLSAKVLEAKRVERNDERDYVIPDNIDLSKIPKIVLDFFMQIHDKSIPDAKLFGAGKGSKGMTLKFWLKTARGSCPVTVAWGGIHGAKPCVIIEETEDLKIRNKDVGSLYPNSMTKFGYCSRSMKDPKAYEKIIDKRLGYKKKAKEYSKKISSKLENDWYKKYETEDLSWSDNLEAIRQDVDEATFNDIKLLAEYEAKQASLKLVINTVYGAMLNLHNDLADRWAGRSVCITNQLCMVMLIVQLAEQCKTIDFVNINTDGIMYTIDKSELDLADMIVATWCEITKFEMEDDDFVKVIQKDVNNYIGITPSGKFKTKGGYVSLYKGGNFKTNSLQIIHKAIVDYLVKGIPPEKTINECKDIFAFQQIVKTGGTYEGAYHYTDFTRVPIQKVNRIYAVKDPKYGQVVKGKWITEKRKKDKATGKMISESVNPPVWSETVISECPEHCFIDNENTLTVEDLDKDYYIDMAKKRIDKYINIDRKVENELKKIKEVIEIMATKKETVTSVPELTEEEKKIRGLNLPAKLLLARKRFLEMGVKKTGKNTYAEFKYFTLDDIIPVKQAIFELLGIVDIVAFGTEVATLTLVNIDNTEEAPLVFSSPLAPDESLIKNPIQKLGAVETYIRRYLYLMMLDIVEADAIEELTDKPAKEEAPKKSNKPATPEKREEVKKDLIDEGGEATDVQVKSIKAGLKKLRAKDGEKYEGYVTECVKAIKAGLKKSEAEDMLIEIGKKIEE